MTAIYPTLSSSPFTDFKPYQSILVGLVLDNLDRDDVWEDGTAQANRAYVQELIAYLIALPDEGE